MLCPLYKVGNLQFKQVYIQVRGGLPNHENLFIAEDTIRPIPPTIARISTTKIIVRIIFVPVDTVSVEETVFAL